jgi:hypothetical protein
MTYDPCERCGSQFPQAFCSQFCHAFKWAQERKIQTGLGEALFQRLRRIEKQS